MDGRSEVDDGWRGARGRHGDDGGSHEPASAQVSVWSGVYTEAQSKRGQALYSGACSQCHGPRLNGAAQSDQPPSPAIARAGFLRKWDGKTVAELFTYVRKMMPTDNPGTLSDQQAIDSIAYMFAVSEIPRATRICRPIRRLSKAS